MITRMGPRLAAGSAVVTWLASLLNEGYAQLCTTPAAVAGTRHNGTQGSYPLNTTLRYSCDTGYKLNYVSPTSTCTSNGSWNPAIKCELDIVSLVIAIIVAFVGVIIFVMAIVYLCKRKRERDSQNIKGKKARNNTYVHYEPRKSTRQNGEVNHGMTSIEMDELGSPLRMNGSVTTANGTNGHPNGLYWNPPSSGTSVNKDSDASMLRRSRKSSNASRSSRTDNAAPFKNEIQLKPDYGDVEFSAPNTNMHNIKQIGSSVNAIAQPSLTANQLDMSLPMPTSPTPIDATDSNLSPDSNTDFSDMYAVVNKSHKKINADEKENNNNNSNPNSVVAVATIESDGAYSAIGSNDSTSGSASYHGDELEDAYAAIEKAAEDEMEEGDYAVVKREDEKAQNEDFSGLYASVKK